MALRRFRVFGYPVPERADLGAGNLAADHQSARYGAGVRRDLRRQSRRGAAPGAPDRDQQLVRHGRVDAARHSHPHALRHLTAGGAPRRRFAVGGRRVAHAPPHRRRRRPHGRRRGGGHAQRRRDRPAKLLPDDVPIDYRSGHRTRLPSRLVLRFPRGLSCRTWWAPWH